MSVRRPPDERQGHQTPDVGPAEPPLEPITAHPADRRWLKATKRRWDRFWSSPAAGSTVVSLDLDMLERLFDLMDERERALEAIRAPLRDKEGKAIRGTNSRIVIGSTGQTRPNGLYLVIRGLDAEIRNLEDRMGKSIKSRLGIGMVVGDGPRDDEQPSAGDGPVDPGTTPPDPSLYLIHGSAGRVPPAEVLEPDPEAAER